MVSRLDGIAQEQDGMSPHVATVDVTQNLTRLQDSTGNSGLGTQTLQATNCAARENIRAQTGRGWPMSGSRPAKPCWVHSSVGGRCLRRTLQRRCLLVQRCLWVLSLQKMMTRVGRSAWQPQTAICMQTRRQYSGHHNAPRCRELR